MFKKLFQRFKKIEEKESVQTKEKEPAGIEEKVSKELAIEITELDNFTKVDIKDNCTVIEYVETMQKRGAEWVSDKIPNATLFDKSTNINKKVIYLFEKENIKYSCYTNDNIIFINERIYEENNHIDERIIKVYINEDNYIVSRMKHDETRSTYFVKSHEKKDPNYEFFQLGKENAIKIIKEVLSSLEQIQGVSSILDLALIRERMIDEHLISPIKDKEEIKVKIKK